MNLKPTEDRVLCSLDEPISKTKGGIIIPDNHKERPRTAIVVAIGPGAMLSTGERAPMSVQVGDRVLFTKHTGTPIREGQEEFLLMHEHDIQAKIGE